LVLHLRGTAEASQISHGQNYSPKHGQYGNVYLIGVWLEVIVCDES
jgi:hypothetical protein